MEKVLKIKNETILVNNIPIKTLRKDDYRNMYRQILECIEKNQEGFTAKSIFNAIYELENYDYVYVILHQLNKATIKTLGEPLFLKKGSKRIINPCLKKQENIKLIINLPTKEYQKFLNEYGKYIIKENKD